MTIATLLLLVFGGALAVEGFAWAFSASAMRRLYDEMIHSVDDRTLSLFGLISLFIGLVMILIAVRLGT